MTIKNGSTPSQDPIMAIPVPDYGTESVVYDEATTPMIGETTPFVPPIETETDAAPVCRDVPFAILFYIHLAVMLWLGIGVAPKGYDKIDINFTAIEEHIAASDDVDMTADQIEEFEVFAEEAARYLQVYPERIVLFLVLPVALLAFLVAYLVTTLLLTPFPKTMVYGCLIESFAIMALVMIAGTIASGSFFTLLITIVSLTAIAYYVRIAWRMVPFAAVNLKVALVGLSKNCGMYVIGLFFAELSAAWVIYWFYVVIGVSGYQSAKCRSDHPDSSFDITSDNFDDVCDPPGAVMLLFLLSLYWTTVITTNLVQITVAGVVATWCYAKEDASSCCSMAVLTSLYRSMTYSFGSVCMGSLLQALVTLLRQMVEQARQQRDRDNDCNGCGSLFLCIIECLASLLEDIIYIFNQYAFIFAGIYGLSYMESGRKVMDLFRARGWTTLITNNLVGYVLGFTVFTVSLATGFLGLLVEKLVTAQLKGADDPDASYIFGPIPGAGYWAFGLSFIIGLWVSGVMMNVVKGGVNTIIVCWADSPTVFEANHPNLTKEMALSWTQVFPELNFNIPTLTATAV